MSWLAPSGLAWLALLGPLVALYVLRPRRVERVVSSTWLWSGVARELSARHPWQRLRPYLSLLIQALAILAGALALARPSCGAMAVEGETVALVVDASLSMAASDAEGTRLALAARRAASITRGLGPGGRVIVIAAGTAPTQRLGPSRDAERVRAIVASTPLIGASPRFADALALAEARLRGMRGPKRIVVLSDGAVSEAVRATPAIDTRIERVGQDVVNVAIVAADVRARDAEPDRMEIFVRVRVSGAPSRDVAVVVTSEDGVMLVSRRITVRQGAAENVVATARVPARADGAAAVLRIALEGPEGGPLGDALPADDVAVRFAQGEGRLATLLVGDVPTSIVRGLRADRRVDALVTTPDAYAARRGEARPFAGLVVLGHDVSGPFPVGASLVVSPDAPATFGIALDPAVPSARIVTFDASDPRLRFGAREDARMSGLRAVRSGVPLVTTDRGVAIASVRRRDGEALVLGFDPDASDLAREPELVLFLHDVVSEARRTLDATDVADGRLGEPLRIRAPDVDVVSVRDPSGRVVSREVKGGVAVVATTPEPGIYEVRAGGRTHRVLRALLDAEESDLSARLALRAGGAAVGAPARAPEERREWLPLLALGLLVLLVVDAAWWRRQEAL